jgi:hypothetical protein
LNDFFSFFGRNIILRCQEGSIPKCHFFTGNRLEKSYFHNHRYVTCGTES